MGKKPKTSEKDIDRIPSRPAETEEARENQMISLAINLAEQQLMDGTASSQVITHYLKLGSSKNKLEKEKLEEENKLLRAKTEALEAAKNMDKVYAEAIEAMKSYAGFGGIVDD